MLTIEEIESTQEMDYEHSLEGLGESRLRKLIANTDALRLLMPAHLSAAEGKSIAEGVLAKIAASTGHDAKTPPAAAQSALNQLFDLFWAPFK